MLELNLFSGHLMLLTDPVVCLDCNSEDALVSNMIREIAENTAIMQFFFRTQSFQGLGL